MRVEGTARKIGLEQESYLPLFFPEPDDVPPANLGGVGRAESFTKHGFDRR